MSKINKIKLMLQQMLATFNQVTTDKGILRYDGDEIEVGASVTMVDEEGTESPVEDGSYYLGDEDGRTIVIEGGVVKEIIEKEEVAEVVVEQEEEQPVEEEVVEEIKDEIQEVAEDVVEDVKEEQPDEAQQRIADLEALVEELKARIAELENKPAAEPAQEEFKRVNQVTKTGIAKLDKLQQKLGF